MSFDQLDRGYPFIGCSRHARRFCSMQSTWTLQLRGRPAHCKLTERKRALGEIAAWLRRKRRRILWRQWKRLYTRVKNLMKTGLRDEQAFRSAFKQRGPCWNSGASHMNAAIPKSRFARLGLVSPLDTTRRFQCLS